MCRFGSSDCGFPVESRELDVFPESRSQTASSCGDPDFQEYAQLAVQHYGLQQPQDWESATEFYFTLKAIARL